MALSFNQTLTYHLGYTLGTPVNVPEFSSEQQLVILDVISRLDAIDAELEANRKDSMALDVGGVRVDFNRNIQITRAEGSRLLRLLSQLSGIPLAYDRYLGRHPGDSSVTPLAVPNYA